MNTVEKAFNDVHLTTGITREELQGPCRKLQCVLARMLLYGRLNERRMGVTDIARITRRTHATIIHYRHRYRDEVLFNPVFAYYDNQMKKLENHARTDL